MYRFVFERHVPLTEALRLIELALDDEGLTLLARGCRLDDITAIVDGDEKVVCVPESRIAEREDQR